MPDRQATAMLDCEDGEIEANSNCKHCQATGDNQQQRYWDIQLDQDLLETICSIYPEWFKDCNMNLGPENNNNSSTDIKSVKQEETQQKTIDKSKESLKVKLMLRRPFNQLVDQGLIPSLKSSPSFHESRQKLERAKMGDILKHKIQKKPDRQELIQQHILEDSCNDSSLQDNHRQLKRARLADGLNERLSQKSGALELVKVNILHADEILAQAVREGGLSFTCDSPSPQLRLGPDEDSGSDGTFSPSPPYDCNEHSQGSLPSLDANESSPNPNQGSPCSAGAFSMSPPSSASSPLSVIPAVVSPQSTQEQIFDYMVHMQHTKETNPNKNRKKTKPKTQPKARTIKFHEYKGPPNAQKNSPVTTSTATTEPSYDLLLQQQQLQLQWQLEWLQKNPQAVLHTPQKRSGDQISQSSQKVIQNNQTQQMFEAPASPQKLLSKLEDMKVSDLKTELKKRNLPVSGSKPLLIERLKSYSEIPQASISNTASTKIVSSLSQQPVVSQFLDNLSTIPTDVSTITGNISSVENGMDTIKTLLNSVSSNSRPSSTVSFDLEATNGLDITDVVSDSSSASFSNEDIVQLQQRFIEKLQRELEKSQLQLQQSKQSILSHSTSSSAASSKQAINMKTPLHSSYSESTSSTNNVSPSMTNASANNDHLDATPPSESKSLQRQMIHQYLQQKIQNQQLQQRLLQEVQKKQASQCPTSESSSTNSNSTLTALLESRPMNATPVDLDVVTEVVTSFSTSANDNDCNRTDNMTVNSYSGLISVENTTENTQSSVVDETDFPGVIPIENVSENDDLEAQFDVVSPLMVNVNGQSDGDSTAISNTLSNRSSSLPSFSALVSCKPSPTRSNTDPHFVITRPPPDYNEATRQLNKVKQQLKSDDVQQNKVRKSSLKSQVVDDVLEILIKNGELPPSAAQEPSPSISKTEQASVPIFTNTNDVFFSKPMTTTSLMSTTMGQSSSVKDALNGSTDLHLSLQSVLELTPPSSAGFGDAGSAPTSSLDFDFSLDMSEIEGMDLESLENPQTSSHSDINLSSTVMKDSKPCVEFLSSSSVNSSSHISRAQEMADISDRGTDRSMDMDLIEWLEVLEETSGTSSASSNFHHPSSYGIANDHDPLFSTNAHETLDLFSSDDIDFKPQSDLNFLPWGDKTDFTT